MSTLFNMKFRFSDENRFAVPRSSCHLGKGHQAVDHRKLFGYEEEFGMFRDIRLEGLECLT
jgi:hypothetical protein